MKYFLFSLLMIGFLLPVSAQKFSPKAKRYLDSTFVVMKNVHGLPKVTRATVNSMERALKKASTNRVFNDTILVKVLKMEKLALQNQTKGVWDANMVRRARSKVPGNSLKAVNRRLEMYATMKR